MLEFFALVLFCGGCLTLLCGSSTLGLILIGIAVVVAVIERCLSLDDNCICLDDDD